MAGRPAGGRTPPGTDGRGDEAGAEEGNAGAMPPLVDYHTHSLHSIDSRATVRSLCRAAIRSGLEELAVTDHLDGYPGDPSTGYCDLEVRAREIARAQAEHAGRLRVLHGLELSEPHRYPWMRRLASGGQWDFLIGSVHYVGDALVGPGYGAGRTMAGAYRAYFEEVLAMVEGSDFHVIGHLDFPKRYTWRSLGPFEPAAVEGACRAVLEVAVARGIGLEVNTEALYREARAVHPHPLILRWYREAGGEIVTLGSDAHAPRAVGRGIARAQALLRAVGFQHFTVFRGGRPAFVPLNAAGTAGWGGEA